MTTIRLLLNSGFTGANAFFALAQTRRLFEAAALDVEFTAGRGAYSAAQRLAYEDFDAAYGDVNALIELAALHPHEELPRAVLMVHQQTPAVISVARQGPIARAADLVGATVLGHASDVALRLFALYAAREGLSRGTIAVQTADGPMLELVQAMLQGRAAGVFGYATTHTAALASAGLRAPQLLRFLPYASSCSDLYGSALMVSARCMRDAPGPVRSLVRAVREGITLAQSDPESAIAAAYALDGRIDKEIEAERWRGTLAHDMACAGPVPPGFGRPDLARLERSIGALQQAHGWAHRPSAERIAVVRDAAL